MHPAVFVELKRHSIFLSNTVQMQMQMHASQDKVFTSGGSGGLTAFVHRGCQNHQNECSLQQL